MKSSSGSQSLYVEGLGTLVVHRNTRAKRLTFRVRHNKLHLTAPTYTSERDMYQAASSLRERLKSLLTENRTPLIDLDFKIKTDYFELEVREGTHNKFYAQSQLGKLLLISPQACVFADAKLQAWLYKVIIEALRRNAKLILLPMLYQLARKYQISYHQVKINTSRGRWGSCSGKKNINLSAYLMLLPKHLIEYVLLHELAHTLEMNHGAQFWKVLNQLTEGKAKTLDKELKQYKTSLFTNQPT